MELIETVFKVLDFYLRDDFLMIKAVVAFKKAIATVGFKKAIAEITLGLFPYLSVFL